MMSFIQKNMFSHRALSRLALAAILALSSLTTAQAATIAIIDSGTDLNHPDLTDRRWVSPTDVDDAVDEDDNGYIDDVHGWNFAEDNNKLFDKRLLGTFSSDVYRYFEIQAKSLRGTASDAEKAWVKTKMADEAFISELSTFGNFVHGTHVAGIAAAGSPGARIMPLKLLPTRTPKPFSLNPRAKASFASAQAGKGEALKKKLIEAGIGYIGKQQAQLFVPISAYLKSQGAQVANCSFGTGFRQMKMVLGPLLNKVFGRELSEDEMHGYIALFVNTVMTSTSDAFVHAAPNTLFVMAAGNDGMDNDRFPTSPANIKASNSITVAATDGLSRLASFSNYGVKMVDVAAPGVAILAAMPGGENLVLSGTSQAAPFVSNVAGRVMDANPDLTVADVRRVLMDTVDLKDFLMGKVASGGIVNAERAVEAARLARVMPLSTAIQKAIGAVKDQRDLFPTEVPASSSEDWNAFVQPLPGLQF